MWAGVAQTVQIRSDRRASLHLIRPSKPQPTLSTQAPQPITMRRVIGVVWSFVLMMPTRSASQPCIAEVCQDEAEVAVPVRPSEHPPKKSSLRRDPQTLISVDLVKTPQTACGNPQTTPCDPYPHTRACPRTTEKHSTVVQRLQRAAFHSTPGLYLRGHKPAAARTQHPNLVLSLASLTVSLSHRPRHSRQKCCDQHDSCYMACGVPKETCEKAFGKCLRRHW